MQAMQYDLALPADYDMGIIRHRVATRAPATDGLAGLRLKAYLARFSGRAGAVSNAYAPFYIWDDVGAMGAFLFEGPFQALVDSFGRPAVQSWTVAGFAYGDARGAAPLWGTRRDGHLARDWPVSGVRELAARETATHGSEGGMHSATFAICLRSWATAKFALWASEPPPGQGTAYEVLHLSQPGAN